MVNTNPVTLKQMEQAKALVVALENGDGETANLLVEEMGRIQESMLFQEVCKLTRQLHDALSTFYLDERLSRLTQNEIPDAKERLNYVITMTEQAANTTLNAVEELLPVTEEFGQQAHELGEKWERFRAREMSVEEFRILSQQVAQYFTGSKEHLGLVQERLTEILMAQDFQDLTGQIIRRVITLVQDLESSMVDMIRLSGGAQPEEEKKTSDDGQATSRGHGPAVPGLDTGTVSNQDDVDSLLSSLGF